MELKSEVLVWVSAVWTWWEDKYHVIYQMNQIENKFYIPPGNPSLKFEIQAGGGLAGSGGGGGGSIE